MVEVRVDAQPEDLEELRHMLNDELGEKIEVQEISSSANTELREPLLIGLIVAMGGPILVKQTAEVIRRWMQHREKMAELAINNKRNAQQLEFAKLRLLTSTDSRPISLDDLESIAVDH